MFLYLLLDEETMTLFKKHVSDPKINARKSALEVWNTFYTLKHFMFFL